MLARPSHALPNAVRWLSQARRSPITMNDLTSMNLTEVEYASTIVHGRGTHPPFFHPRTHNIPVALIHLRSYHPRLLDLFIHFATHAASSLGIPVSKAVYLPTQRSLWTVLKSPFVHKKSQENFERKVHKRAIKAWDADAQVVDHWLKYLRHHMLAGVGMRTTTWQRMPIGVGEATLKEVKHLLRTQGMTDAERVKALGDEIISSELGAGADVESIPKLP